jgi:hypothetical protein
MNPPGPHIPNEAAVRDEVTDGPVPEFEDSPQVSVDGLGVIAPGDVFYHGRDDLILIDIDLADNPGDATLHMFNQRTTIVAKTTADEMASLVQSNFPTFHFSDILIPADATYHVEPESERGLPRTE